ncbi:MAG TPA: DUF1918 domain-containing protein, partial [Egibacteraceae bacterium]|nr:DUF1918 domain-containing protein [Egibacteraceae bacterium]HVM20717.1 DUF1918 domain-containing protein [Egibacteraceae bacterium]
MQAHVGDTITIPGRHVGEAFRTGQVLEVSDAEGRPPYRVRWDDGHEGLCYPPPEARLEPAGR